MTKPFARISSIREAPFILPSLCRLDNATPLRAARGILAAKALGPHASTAPVTRRWEQTGCRHSPVPVRPRHSLSVVLREETWLELFRRALALGRPGPAAAEPRCVREGTGPRLPPGASMLFRVADPPHAGSREGSAGRAACVGQKGVCRVTLRRNSCRTGWGAGSGERGLFHGVAQG